MTTRDVSVITGELTRIARFRMVQMADPEAVAMAETVVLVAEATAAPVVEVTVETADPVVETAAPVVEVMVETAAPVATAETAAPVVVATAAPVVVATVAPVAVAMVAPVAVATVAPVATVVLVEVETVVSTLTMKSQRCSVKSGKTCTMATTTILTPNQEPSTRLTKPLTTLSKCFINSRM